MATQQPASTNNVKLVVSGKPVELVITTRNIINHLQADDIARITARTLTAWVYVWRAIESGEALPDVVLKGTPEDLVFSKIENQGRGGFDSPVCTVWNKDWNGLTVTVHSNDTGEGALATAQGMVQGLDMWRDFAQNDLNVRFNDTASTQHTQAPQNAPNQAPAQNAQVNPVWSQLPELSAPMMLADGGALYTYDYGKGQAQFALARKPIERDTVQYADKARVLFPVTSIISKEVTVKDEPKRIIELNTPQGSITVWGDEESRDWQGKSIPTDWGKVVELLQRVGINAYTNFVTNAEGLAVGVKIAHSNGKEYMNVSNLFRVSGLPTGATSSADGTPPEADGDDIPF